MAPKIIGGLNAPTPVGELGMSQMTQAINLIDHSYEQVSSCSSLEHFTLGISVKLIDLYHNFINMHFILQLSPSISLLYQFPFFFSNT